MTRRALLSAAAPLLAAASLRIEKLEWLPIQATARTWWLNLRLTTNTGLSGLGEASDGFGLTPAVGEYAERQEAEVRRVFAAVQGQYLPNLLNVRKKMHREILAKGLTTATAVSALEQAAMDIEAKRQGKALVDLLGARKRDAIPVYANINRAAKPRTPEGFVQVAKRAWADGFRAVKLAPFDGGAPVPLGIDCVYAVREALGPQAQIMVDAHSFFEVDSGIALAKKLEGAKLTWLEEPVAPERVADTAAIRRKVSMPMAGGETLYGVEGFAALCRTRAVDTIMPDVKHCGGLREMMAIARMAARFGIMVAPHNPSGPVATAHSLAVCGAMANCNFLEIQYGEVEWRARTISPNEAISNGLMKISNLPGCGVELSNPASYEIQN
jgi:galactonate dehydratase